jgi:hypothetical protein
VFLEVGRPPEYQKWQHGTKVFPTAIQDEQKKRGKMKKIGDVEEEEVESEKDPFDSYSAVFSKYTVKPNGDVQRKRKEKQVVEVG